MGRLAGKIAVITGGSSGIGLATAERFVKEGARVFITGRRAAELASAVARIGDGVTAVQGDVSDPDHLDRLYACVEREAGALDIVFANAGIGERARLEEITPEHFDRLLSVNLKGPLFTVQKALPLLRPGGSIILNGSITASKGFESYSVYSATKAALRALARVWTMELRSRQLRVNVVSPGPIETPMYDTQPDVAEELRRSFALTTPLGRMGRPEELAAAVAFLASDESSYVAGTEFFVDGGYAQV